MAIKLTPKQDRFCIEYIIDLNATQAAIRAGYSERSARADSSRMLTNANIALRIAELKATRVERTEITADFVLSSLKEVALRCMEQVPVMKWDYVTKSMIQETTTEGSGVWEFDSTGANKSLELLGKHVGIFKKDNEQAAPTAVIINGPKVDLKKISTNALDELIAATKPSTDAS